MINAHKELGYLSADFATDILIKKAKKFDNAILAFTNSYYYSMAGIYARKVAKAGFVAIILNNGGPMAVAPFGGIDPLLGTNPIAIGIPTEGEPIVHDMATSEKTWGETNLAKVEKRTLQEKTFLDKEGKYTTDPYAVEAIVPFGGAKGYGLNLMFEILTGALVGAKMGSEAKNGYDLGFLFLALSPTMFSSLEQFAQQVSQLVAEIKGSRTMPGVKEILIPGERSEKLMKEKLATGFIDIDGNAWENLLAFAQGKNVKELMGLVE